MLKLKKEQVDILIKWHNEGHRNLDRVIFPEYKSLESIKKFFTLGKEAEDFLGNYGRMESDFRVIIGMKKSGENIGRYKNSESMLILRIVDKERFESLFPTNPFERRQYHFYLKPR